MQSADSFQRAPQRRPRIWKFVLVAVVLAALVEPLVMYRILEAQRERRQEAAGLVIPAAVHKAAPR